MKQVLEIVGAKEIKTHMQTIENEEKPWLNQRFVAKGEITEEQFERCIEKGYLEIVKEPLI